MRFVPIFLLFVILFLSLPSSPFVSSHVSVQVDVEVPSSSSSSSHSPAHRITRPIPSRPAHISSADPEALGEHNDHDADDDYFKKHNPSVNLYNKQATDDVDILPPAENNGHPIIGGHGQQKSDAERYKDLLDEYAQEDNSQAAEDPNFGTYRTFPANPIVGGQNTTKDTTSPCAHRGGVCQPQAECTVDGGKIIHHLCGGKTDFCCFSEHNPSVPFHSADDKQCTYNGLPTLTMNGNNAFPIVLLQIQKKDLTNPSSYSHPPDASDNTISVSVACAWDAMRTAAASHGIHLTISSGFRTLKRQKYLYGCYQHKNCNNGALAAFPGTSNHGLGLALDLNTAEKGSKEYKWMKANGWKYKFIRTVFTENWHWEYRPEAHGPASYT